MSDQDVIAKIQRARDGEDTGTVIRLAGVDYPKYDDGLCDHMAGCVVDPQSRTVTCDKCGGVIDPVEKLLRMRMYENRMQMKIDAHEKILLDSASRSRANKESCKHQRARPTDRDEKDWYCPSCHSTFVGCRPETGPANPAILDWGKDSILIQFSRGTNVSVAREGARSLANEILNRL